MMMRLELFDARRQAAKGLAVGRQHQRLGIEFAQALEGAEPAAQRIRLRFHIAHQNVRADLRQQLVAGDQQRLLLAVEAEMLRRVSLSHDDPPLTPSDLEEVAVAQPSKAGGVLWHEAV